MQSRINNFNGIRKSKHSETSITTADGNPDAQSYLRIGETTVSLCIYHHSVYHDDLRLIIFTAEEEKKIERKKNEQKKRKEKKKEREKEKGEPTAYQRTSE